MMSTTIKLFAVIGILAICLQACSDDESSVIKITASDFEVTIPENPATGHVVGTIEASIQEGTLTFALSEATLEDGAFAIHETTGELSVANRQHFDFEEAEEVVGTVIVSSGNETKEVSVRVLLTNVHEITVSNFTATTAENRINGDVLGNLGASTTNEGSLVYGLSGETPAGAIAVAENGNIYVLNKDLFNFELRTTITATVQVNSNHGSDFKHATITITLTDVAETVQQRLDDGETPKQIYDKDNALLNQFYAKTYGGGIIGAFNTSTGSCLILSGDRGGSYTASTAITTANNLVLNGYEDWRLPTYEESQLLGTALATGTNVLPTGGYYWTSTNCGGICVQTFYIGSSGLGGGGEPSSNTHPLMAIRIQN